MSASTEKTSGRGDVLAERLVVLFLLIAAAVMAYIQFEVIPESAPTGEVPFDIRNPLLDAEVGECVLGEDTSSPGDIVCMRVIEPGVVLRTRAGPERLGVSRELHTSAAYLAVGLRYPPSGKTCTSDEAGREDIELFGLNDFGMPSSTYVELQGIRPMWVERGGRHRFVYEVQVMRYGRASGPYTLYVDADFPVTGTLVRHRTTPRGIVHRTVFSEDPDCR